MVSNPQRQSSQPPMFLNIVLFDLIFGILGWALIRGWAHIRISKVYLGQVNPARLFKNPAAYETRTSRDPKVSQLPIQFFLAV